MKELTIGFFIYPDYQTIDLAGPLDAFDLANSLSEKKAQLSWNPPCRYRLMTVSPSHETVRSESGLQTVADVDAASCPKLDILVVPGGKGSRALCEDAAIIEWLKDRIKNSRRTLSICTGSYLVAATGMYNGRSLSTHWDFADDMAARFPKVNIQAEKLFVQDSKYYSSGGMTAGIDLALAIIEKDMGADLAQEVARYLVMYLRRTGDQRQYSQYLKLQQYNDHRLEELMRWLVDNLDSPMTVEAMAEKAAMSTRHFRRIFKEKTNESPISFLEKLRMEKARILLSTSKRSVELISQDVGFNNADVFRRTFKKHFQISPLEYRNRFGEAL